MGVAAVPKQFLGQADPLLVEGNRHEGQDRPQHRFGSGCCHQFHEDLKLWCVDRIEGHVQLLF